jgi:hypothetical protein
MKAIVWEDIDMKRLRKIAEEATQGIDELLVTPLTEEQTAKVEEIIEQTVIKALLEGQHRAVDAAIKCPEADQDVAHKIATAIRQENDALIVNLSSLR